MVNGHSSSHAFVIVHMYIYVTLLRNVCHQYAVSLDQQQGVQICSVLPEVCASFCRERPLREKCCILAS